MNCSLPVVDDTVKNTITHNISKASVLLSEFASQKYGIGFSTLSYPHLVKVKAGYVILGPWSGSVVSFIDVRIRVVGYSKFSGMKS